MLGRYICISPPGSNKWDGDPISSAPRDSIIFKVPPTSFGTLPAQTQRANYTTSYLVPTSYPPVPISSIVQNETANSILGPFMSLCPWGKEYYEVGLTYWDAPGNCPSLLEPYCFPVIREPMPQPTQFPLLCYPPGYQLNMTMTNSNVSSTAPSSTFSTLPTPTGSNRNCTVHYTAKLTDTCQRVVETYVGLGPINFQAFHLSRGIRLLAPTAPVSLPVSTFVLGSMELHLISHITIPLSRRLSPQVLHRLKLALYPLALSSMLYLLVALVKELSMFSMGR